MSKDQTLRDLVNGRLAAAAEDIFRLFERTIAEYKEELCRSEKENRWKQQMLDSMVGPRVLPTVGDQISLVSPGPDLKQEFVKSLQIKGEPDEESVKIEEQLELNPVCAETEESSLLPQRQTEAKEESQGEDIGSDPHFHPKTEGDTEHSSVSYNNEDCEPFSYSFSQLETEAGRDQYNQVQIRDRSIKMSPQNTCAPETNATVNSRDVSGADEEAERKKHQCSVCKKRFGFKSLLEKHLRVHTGERPYSCSICNKEFGQIYGLRDHRRLHTGEKPFSCALCSKTFAHSSSLRAHMKTHTGERPYSCSRCSKTFPQSSALTVHMRTHTGDRPYSCSHCSKTFAQSSALAVHMRTHTGDRPYRCSLCNKTFTQTGGLTAHMCTHTSERPYSCAICNETFTTRRVVELHMSSTHGSGATAQHFHSEGL
uniref:C2H2-type domain-containing protein n=1 Tax=Neogobius melanostomus TaxID=47308 RepID=A0A8C6WLS7_9GOBI